MKFYLNSTKRALIFLGFLNAVIFPVNPLLAQEEKPAEGKDVDAQAIVQNFKTANHLRFSKGLLPYLKELSEIAKTARKRNDYDGLLIADQATRLGCYAALKSLVSKTVAPGSIIKALEGLPEVTPSLEEWKLILANVDFSNVSSESWSGKIPDPEMLQAFVMAGDSGSDAAILEGKVGFAELLKKPDYRGLLLRIIGTQKIQNQLLPIAIDFTKRGGEILKINPADVSETIGIYEEAVSAAKPTLLPPNYSGGLVWLKEEGESVLKPGLPDGLRGYGLR